MDWQQVTQYWQNGGVLMVPLTVLTLAMWYWTLSLHLRLRGAIGTVRSSDDLTPILTLSSDERVRSRLREWADKHGGPIGAVVRHVAAGRLEREEVRRRFAEARSEEMGRFTRELQLLRTLIVAAPLTGLLGTVSGMLTTFGALSLRGAAPMELVSTGISQALITTQVGLIIALPGLFAAHAASLQLKEVDLAFSRLAHRLSIRRSSAVAVEKAEEVTVED